MLIMKSVGTVVCSRVKGGKAHCMCIQCLFHCENHKLGWLRAGILDFEICTFLECFSIRRPDTNTHCPPAEHNRKIIKLQTSKIFERFNIYIRRNPS